jgi:hypothetical protein
MAERTSKRIRTAMRHIRDGGEGKQGKKEHRLTGSPRIRGSGWDDAKRRTSTDEAEELGLGDTE